MNKQNNLPKYWVVKNTNNDDFKVVMNYLNENHGSYYKYGNHEYYGYDGCGNNNSTGTICMDSTKYFKNNPILLTLEEFKKAIGIEEEFVLPKKWCVRSIGKDEYQKYLEPYIGNDYFASRWDGKDYYYHFEIGRITKANNTLDISYTEITFEQFKKYVLKMNDNKKIIGYKSPIKFGNGVEVGMIFERIPNIANYYRPKDKHDDIFNRLPQEIVETWEPIYEEEVKTINMGSFNLTVKDKKVFHKNEDITDVVLDISKYRIMQKVGRYTARIENITFSSVGCENNETKLSDWLKVYDMIK